jgi:hypothetical protein
LRTSNEVTQAQVEGLATLLVLNDEIRKLSTVREFGFFTTNETHRLIRYHTAYLWGKKDFLGVQLVAQSGTPELDIHSPANQWVVHKIKAISESPTAEKIKQIDNPNQKNTNDIEWPESLPANILWCPFVNKKNEIVGGLIFFRETLFTDTELKMVQWLINSYQYIWSVLNRPSKLTTWKALRKKPYFLAILILSLAVLFFPVHISILGNGIVVPDNPILINAPMQGVIQSFAVTPGSQVKAGQLLLTMEKTDLLSASEVDQRNFLLTEAKLRTAVNEAFDNKEKRAEVPILQAQLSIDKAHLDYTNAQLAKTEIRSPINGIVIFDSKEDWVGQPVQTGERILMVANSSRVKLRINVTVADIIPIEVGTKGDFFLNGKFSSVAIKLTTLGYNAKLMPNKTLAYQLEANFVDPKEKPQIGLQGTVKLYGHRVPFIYFILRKPLQAIRQKLGI